VLLLLLEQEGRLALSGAPVTHLLPELSGSPYATADLLALATHRSGLPGWRPLYLQGSSLGSYLEQIARTPLAVAPGRTLYTDLGYVLLGAAVERAAETPLAPLFRQRIAHPLGLRRTGFVNDPAEFADAAATERGNRYERQMAGPAGSGHSWRAEVLRGEVHDANAHGLGGAAGHAGLFGPLEEVARLAHELLRGADLPLGGSARRKLLRAVPPGASRTVGFVTAECSSAAAGILAPDAAGHTGFTGTSLWLDPRGDRLFVLLTNRVHPQVQERNFQLLRRAFHRLAMRLTRSGA
jgi:CubicO group peptidase (beta-lactamase class C family)